MICAQKTQSLIERKNDMAQKKRENVRWAIIGNGIMRLVVVSKTDERYVCKDEAGIEHVVSKYDAYKTLHEANAAFDEGLPE